MGESSVVQRRSLPLREASWRRTLSYFWLYLPNAEMTLDLEVNEVEVKVLTSLASVTAITALVSDSYRSSHQPITGAAVSWEVAVSLGCTPCVYSPPRGSSTFW